MFTIFEPYETTALNSTTSMIQTVSFQNNQDSKILNDDRCCNLFS